VPLGREGQKHVVRWHFHEERGVGPARALRPSNMSEEMGRAGFERASTKALLTWKSTMFFAGAERVVEWCFANWSDIEHRHRSGPVAAISDAASISALVGKPLVLIGDRDKPLPVAQQRERTVRAQVAPVEGELKLSAQRVT
jgi:hypothetical protein